MKFHDPFSSDTDKFKRLLDNDSRPEIIMPQEVTAEEFDSRTVKGLPPSIFKAAQEQVKRQEMTKQQKAEVTSMFNKLFDDLNDKYGLNLSMDFDSLNGTANQIIETDKKKAMEYYLSEAYGRFRVVLYGGYLQAIALLSAQILDPNYLLSESMTYDQKLDTMQRLYEFMKTMNEIHKEVNIPDTDLKLTKLTSDQKKSINLDDPAVREFMKQMFENANKSSNKDHE